MMLSMSALISAGESLRPRDALRSGDNASGELDRLRERAATASSTAAAGAFSGVLLRDARDGVLLRELLATDALLLGGDERLVGDLERLVGDLERLNDDRLLDWERERCWETARLMSGERLLAFFTDDADRDVERLRDLERLRD